MATKGGKLKSSYANTCSSNVDEAGPENQVKISFSNSQLIYCLPCRLGAAITVTTPGTSAAFLKLLYNSACFATYEDTLVTPTDWEDVSGTIFPTLNLLQLQSAWEIIIIVEGFEYNYTHETL